MELPSLSQAVSDFGYFREHPLLYYRLAQKINIIPKSVDTKGDPDKALEALSDPFGADRPIPYDGPVAATPAEPTPLATLAPPSDGDDWTGLSAAPLPVTEAAAWVVRPDCGGVVVFTGTARDHSVGRDGVTRLEYEAYEEQVVPRLDEIAALGMPVVVPLMYLKAPDTTTLHRSAAVSLREMVIWEQSPTNARRLIAAGVPEPTSLMLLAAGAGAAGLRRRK